MFSQALIIEKVIMTCVVCNKSGNAVLTNI